MVADAMVGGELAFVLDGTPVPFSLSQDKWMRIGNRKRKRVMSLKNDHNP